MTLHRMPNGEYVDIEAGASPETIKRIKLQHTKKAAGGSDDASQVQKRKTPHEQEVERRLAVQRQRRDNDLTPNFLDTRGGERGLLANFNDEFSGAIAAGTRGVVNAVRKGDVREIGREYKIQRDVERGLNQDYAGDHPFADTIGQVAGSLMVPAGAVAKGASKVLPAAVTRRAQAAGPVTKGIGVGAGWGTVNGVGNAEGDELNNGVWGGVVGALSGGAIGGLARAGRGIANVFQDRAPEHARRVATERIVQVLSKASDGKNPATGQPVRGITPERAALTLDRAKREGNGSVLMDLSPGLRAQAGAIARKPNVPSSNDLVAFGESRLQDRNNAFAERIAADVGPLAGKGIDADDAVAGIGAARKAHGEANYDEVLDKPWVWNDELLEWFDNAGPSVRAAAKRAVALMRDERLDPTTLGFVVDDAGELVKAAVPNMRAMDYIKRGFDDEIGAALKAGDKNKARILSNELQSLKAGIAVRNPEYAEVLAGQRDFFQQAEAVEFGRTVLQQMRVAPNKVLKELQSLEPAKQADARTGVVHALIGMSEKNANPVSALTTIMRTPRQRKVLEFVFGGRSKLSKFERWLKREIRGNQSDALTAPGRQSATDLFKQATESMNNSDAAREVGSNVARGFAYGGNTGGAAAAVRSVNELRRGSTNEIYDEMAKLLMSDGSSLPASAANAAAFAARRKAGTERITTRAAKAGQQVFTGKLGG